MFFSETWIALLKVGLTLIKDKNSIRENFSSFFKRNYFSDNKLCNHAEIFGSWHMGYAKAHVTCVGTRNICEQMWHTWAHVTGVGTRNIRGHMWQAWAHETSVGNCDRRGQCRAHVTRTAVHVTSKGTCDMRRLMMTCADSWWHAQTHDVMR